MRSLEEWKPIETAPKDGARIMVWDGQTQSMSRWSDRFGAWINLCGVWKLVPLCWQKLPEPPKEIIGGTLHGQGAEVPPSVGDGQKSARRVESGSNPVPPPLPKEIDSLSLEDCRQQCLLNAEAATNDDGPTWRYAAHLFGKASQREATLKADNAALAEALRSFAQVLDRYVLQPMDLIELWHERDGRRLNVLTAHVFSRASATYKDYMDRNPQFAEQANEATNESIRALNG